MCLRPTVFRELRPPAVSILWEGALDRLAKETR
jgi:hypothetical protein